MVDGRTLGNFLIFTGSNVVLIVLAVVGAEVVVVDVLVMVTSMEIIDLIYC